MKYLGVIFGKKNYMKLHIETIAAKASRMRTSIYPLLKSEGLSVGTELTLYKALIRSILTYSCPAWEFTADSYLLQLQRLQNKVLRTIGNLPRHTPTRDLHMFKIPYSNDFVTKLCREQATVILNHENVILLLAKVRHVIESIKDSYLVAIRHTIDKLSRQWLYP
jgi:hypothetical protein